MKKIKAWIFLLPAIVGAVAVYFGGFVLTGPQYKTVSGWCIGVGAAAFALGIGKFLDALILSKTQTEEIIRRKNIEVNDERNIRIREKIGFQISRVVNYALCALVLIMGLMRMPVAAILMVVAVILLEFILAIVLSNYYAKRM